MPSDNETTTVINAVDNTGAALKSAARGFSDLKRNLEDVAKRTGVLYSPEEWKKRTDAFIKWNTKLNQGMRQQTEEVKHQAQEQKEHAGILGQVNEELVGMASRYLAVGYSIEKAREGFSEFAKDQEILRVAGARMGATHAQLEKFKETAEQIGHTFGDSFEKVSETMESFREAAYLTANDMDKIKAIAPAIMEVSHRFGVDSAQMGQAFGSFVRQMNIAPAQWEQALGAMGVIAKDLNLDFGQLNRYAPQLTEAMAQLGVTGTDGMNQILALLAMTRKQFGSTTLAARALTQYLDQIQRGGGVAEALGMDTADWTRRTDQVIASGRNLFDFYIDKIREARQIGASWGELFDDPKQRRFWKMMVAGGSEYRNLIAQIKKDSSEYHAGSTKDLENEALQLKRLIYEWDEFWKSVGGAASSLGALEVLRNVTAELRQISEIINKVSSVFEGKTKWTDLLPSIKDLHLPSSSEVFFGMLHGPRSDEPASKTHAAPEHRARGGKTLAGRSYMVGEQGPELFTPNTSGSITSAYTLDRVEKHTDDSNTLLTQIRDLLYKQEQDREKDMGTGGGGDSLGGTGAGAGTNPMGNLSGGGGGGSGKGVTLGDRLNNPGNIKWGKFAKSMGATGPGPGGHAIFPDYATGRKAMESLLGKKAMGQSIGEINKWYAEDPNWKNNVSKFMGVSPNWRLDDPSQIPQLADAIQHAEGTRVGGAKGDAVPDSVLAQAQQVALSGGPDAVQRFMAKNGYPKNGAWCGEFAASVVTAAGGTPPKNPAIASNWRNYGTEVENPQPGDIAVRRGVPTGSTGSHVTIVESTGKGRFTGIGGNQRGGIRSTFPTGRYQFFRGRAAPPTATAGSGLQPTQPMPPVQGLDDVRQLRSELEQPIIIRAQLDKGQDSQFRRASMRREVNREVREASWQSYNDIGAA